MANKGWIKLYRSIQECCLWEIDEPFDKRSAWVDLLLLCNHENKETIFDGKKIIVERGQRITSVRNLSDRWHWSKDKTLKFLRLLESLEMIKSDSDLLADICTKCDESNKVKYVFIDTGIEYKATKDHLDYLENKYGIEIIRVKAVKSIPLSCQEYGVPFLSKFISEMLMRLQRYNFKFEDKSYEELIKEYPKCSSALKWWCNENESIFKIDNKKYLKEFLIENPPNFKISNKCCKYAKKDTALKVQREYKADLNIIGIRKSEGGIRAQAYKNCFTSNAGEIDQYRPIFWYKNDDKKQYFEHYGIKNSDCYSVYGLKRTGCVGCPYSLNFEGELEVVKTYEPKLYKAIINIFGNSYEYTRKYKDFVKSKEAHEQIEGQMTIFDFID